jgi:hypothetical protein
MDGSPPSLYLRSPIDRGGAGERGGMADETLETRLIARLHEHRPFAWCDACLARLFAVTEDQMRAAGLAAAERPGLERRRRACYRCQRTIELTCLV